MDNNKLLQEKKCYQLAQKLGRQLTAKKLLLASAESCTGGLFAKICTDCIGSSKWFYGSIVSYSYESKNKWLGVNQKMLDQQGAVNTNSVISMVNGLFKSTNIDIGVSISGIAGPSNKNSEKQIGTVYFAWAIKNGYLHSDHILFQGDRTDIRIQSVYYAMHGIKQLLEN